MIPVKSMTYRELLNQTPSTLWPKVTGGREINQKLLDVEVDVALDGDTVEWVELESGERVYDRSLAVQV